MDPAPRGDRLGGHRLRGHRPRARLQCPARPERARQVEPGERGPRRAAAAVDIGRGRSPARLARRRAAARDAHLRTGSAARLAGAQELRQQRPRVPRVSPATAASSRRRARGARWTVRCGASCAGASRAPGCPAASTAWPSRSSPRHFSGSRATSWPSCAPASPATATSPAANASARRCRPWPRTPASSASWRPCRKRWTKRSRRAGGSGRARPRRGPRSASSVLRPRPTSATCASSWRRARAPACARRGCTSNCSRRSRRSRARTAFSQRWNPLSPDARRATRPRPPSRPPRPSAAGFRGCSTVATGTSPPWPLARRAGFRAREGACGSRGCSRDPQTPGRGRARTGAPP